MPCWLREQRLRKFNSKDFTSDETKIEINIIQLFKLSREINTFKSNEKEQRKLGTESCVTASDKLGGREESPSISEIFL